MCMCKQSFVLFSVEFVLGITGSTMGCLICYVFPAIMFISIMPKTSGKSTAQVSYSSSSLAIAGLCTSAYVYSAHPLN